MKKLPEEFLKYKNSLVELFEKYDINSIKSLKSTYKNNLEFRNEWKSIWLIIAKENGGKLSLTTMGIIIGSALGGVGIALMGTAFGMPLALILGLGGFLFGSKVDDINTTESIPEENETSITFWDEMDIPEDIKLGDVPKELLEQYEVIECLNDEDSFDYERREYEARISELKDVIEEMQEYIYRLECEIESMPIVEDNRIGLDDL